MQPRKDQDTRSGKGGGGGGRIRGREKRATATEPPFPGVPHRPWRHPPFFLSWRFFVRLGRENALSGYVGNGVGRIRKERRDLPFGKGGVGPGRRLGFAGIGGRRNVATRSQSAWTARTALHSVAPLQRASGNVPGVSSTHNPIRIIREDFQRQFEPTAGRGDLLQYWRRARPVAVHPVPGRRDLR